MIESNRSRIEFGRKSNPLEYSAKQVARNLGESHTHSRAERHFVEQSVKVQFVEFLVPRLSNMLFERGTHRVCSLFDPGQQELVFHLEFAQSLGPPSDPPISPLRDFFEERTILGRLIVERDRTTQCVGQLFVHSVIELCQTVLGCI